jgi:hypothetical protein
MGEGKGKGRTNSFLADCTSFSLDKGRISIHQTDPLFDDGLHFFKLVDFGRYLNAISKPEKYGKQ